MFSREERVNIFMFRFKGRSDVFARRWEKWDGSVSGYAPVYADGRKESYERLTGNWIEKHLMGALTLGVYPLLSDNASNFIAADFDGDGWKESVRAFTAVCKKYNLPVAIERSRSGNGGHAWCFFNKPFPACKSRQIFLTLLREAGTMEQFDKNESFDRLFPNQDYLSGKGLGNLIAFPLQGGARKNGNSVFVDSDRDFAAIEDQWQYLHDILLASATELHALHARLTKQTPSAPGDAPKSGRFEMVLSNMLAMRKANLLPALVSYLREELNLFNIEYIVKERAGLPTYGLRKYITTIESENDRILVPRGFLTNISAWLDKHQQIYAIRDERIVTERVAFTVHHELFGYQEAAVNAFKNMENGILVAPAGAGKTIMGLALIAQKQQSAIILTHRRQIYDQWLERIEHGLGIPKKRTGQLCSIKKDPKLPVSVAMVQTLARLKDWNGIAEKFGTIIVDECHHMPARMFREVVSKFKGKFLFGLTATPERKYNDERLMCAYLGPIIHSIKKDDMSTKRSPAESYDSDNTIVRTTDTQIPFGTTPRDFPLLSKALSNDTRRNALIAADVAREAGQDKKCLILTERKEHAEMLRAHLRRDFEVVLFSGDLSLRQRKLAGQKIKSGRFQILIATGQILGEGTDIAHLDILFLAFPVSFHGKLAQYIGRIRREGGQKKIYDYRDIAVPILEKMWKKRATYYRKNGFTMIDSIHLTE